MLQEKQYLLTLRLEMTSGAQLGGGAQGARAPSFNSHFGSGHRCKQKRSTFYTWAKAMYIIIRPIINTYAPP